MLGLKYNVLVLLLILALVLWLWMRSREFHIGDRVHLAANPLETGTVTGLLPQPDGSMFIRVAFDSGISSDIPSRDLVKI